MIMKKQSRNKPTFNFSLYFLIIIYQNLSLILKIIHQGPIKAIFVDFGCTTHLDLLYY